MRILPTSYLFRLCCHQSQVSWFAASLSQRSACFFELAFSAKTLASAIRPFLLLHLSSTAPIPGIAAITPSPTPSCNADEVLKDIKANFQYDEFEVYYNTIQGTTSLAIWYVENEIDPVASRLSEK